MQRNRATVELQEEVVSAHKLMIQFSGTISDPNQNKKAFEVYKSAIKNVQYTDLDLPIRLAIFYDLNELSNLLLDDKDAILSTILNQFENEAKHPSAEQDIDNFLDKIYSRIKMEKDPHYLEQLQACCDQLTVEIKGKRKLFVPSMLNDRFKYAQAILQNEEAELKCFQVLFRNYNFLASQGISALEKFAEQSKNLSVRLQANLLLGEYADTPEKKSSEMPLAKIAVHSYEAAAKLSSELKQEFNQKLLINAYRKYALLTTDAETYLKAANLGDCNARVKAADIIFKTDSNRASDQYLQALNEALILNDIPVSISIITETLKASHRKALSDNKREAIEQAIVLAFKNPNIIKSYLDNPSAWNEGLSDFSLKTMDQIINELHKTYAGLFSFLTFAESCYSSKLKESGEALAGFTLYSGLKKDLQKLIDEDAIAFNNLVKNVDTKKDLTLGQKLREIIQSFFANNPVGDWHNNSRFEMIKQRLLVLLQKDCLSKINKQNENLKPFFDLTSLLDLRLANENATLVQKEFVRSILNMTNMISLSEVSSRSNKTDLSNDLFINYIYLNFCSTLASVDSSSPFYEFSNLARAASDQLRKNLNTYQARSAGYRILFKTDYSSYLYWVKRPPQFVSRWLGCPFMIADQVTKIVPAGFQLKTKNRNALLASAIYLISSNRNIANTVEYYTSVANDVFDSSRPHWMNGSSRYYEKEIKSILTKTLMDATSNARIFLTKKSNNPKYEYQSLAKLLSGFVEQAELTKQVIDDPLVYIWIKMRKSGIKPEDKKYFEEGLLRFVSDDSNNLLSKLESDLWFSFLDTCVDASNPDFFIPAVHKIQPSAPPAEEKQTPIPSAPPAQIALYPVLTSVQENKEMPKNLETYPMPEAWDPNKFKTSKETMLLAVEEIKVTEVKQEMKGEAKAVEQTVPALSAPPVSVDSFIVKEGSVSTSTEGIPLPSKPLMVEPVSPKAESKSDEGVQSDSDVTPTESTSYFETEPGLASQNSDFKRTLFAEKKPPIVLESNPVSADIEIIETQRGVISVSTAITSPIPMPITFGITKAHLLLAHSGFTPMKLSEPCVYLDAPEGLSVKPAALNISLDISESKGNFRMVSASVTTPESLGVTPVTLNLSIFSQRKNILADAPFVSSSWVKASP